MEEKEDIKVIHALMLYTSMIFNPFIPFEKKIVNSHLLSDSTIALGMPSSPVTSILSTHAVPTINWNSAKQIVPLKVPTMGL